MSKAVYGFGIVALFLASALIYVRLSPSDITRWHQPVDGTRSADFKTGALRVISADADLLALIDTVMKDLPRTRVLAGSVGEYRITYVTRTKWIGFPDYTTVEYGNGLLKMYARQRFGQSDLGVNGERLNRVLRSVER